MFHDTRVNLLIEFMQEIFLNLILIVEKNNRNGLEGKNLHLPLLLSGKDKNMFQSWIKLKTHEIFKKT